MRLATLLGTAALLLATSAEAQDVSYDYDKRADFSALTTYRWAPGGHADDFNHQRIVAAVDSQLARKGLMAAAPGTTPDLVVSYRVFVSRAAEVSGTRAGVARWASARVEDVPVGTLMVDLMDARTQGVVWRGVATRDIDTRAKPEQREKNIAKAVEKLFSHYPPPAK